MGKTHRSMLWLVAGVILSGYACALAYAYWVVYVQKTTDPIQRWAASSLLGESVFILLTLGGFVLLSLAWNFFKQKYLPKPGH